MDDTQNGAQADDQLAATEDHSEQPETLEEEAKAATAEDEGETETDEDAEGDEPEDEDDDDPAERRPRKSGSARLREQNARLRAEVEQLRSRVPASPDLNDGAALARAVQAEIGPPPQERDYRDYLEYERAMTAYTVRATLAEERVRFQATQASVQEQAHFRELVDRYEDGQSAARKAISDYDDVLRSAKDVKLRPDVERAVLESDKAALLAYHLAKRPKDVDRLNGLPPLAMAREIGRIEARLSLPTPNKETKAPPPMRAPRGAATPSSPEREMDSYFKRTYGDRLR